MDYRERGSHARGVYLTQYTSHMGTARGRNRRKNNAIVKNLEERNVGTKEKSHKKELACAKDLPMELAESPYHRLD